ncbi:MAG: methylornithine synthase PylB [Desulfotignum sp.]|jgi:methylornithine synthase|nr:methylornithine synthase PylB [Desulfotignum sp.]
MSVHTHRLTTLLAALEQGMTPEKPDIAWLLGRRDPEDTARLFAAARSVRQQHFGNQVFFYGFLYFSTHCRNNCRFCRYRRANTALKRYRKTKEQILSAAMEMATAGVHLIDLTMGEDPDIVDGTQSQIREWLEMIRSVGQHTHLPVMISPGVVSNDVLADLARAGVTWYACYQETHNEKLYDTLRPGQDYHRRLSGKYRARDIGLLVEEGVLTGVGETAADLADSIDFMKGFPVDQARVMRFVPQSGIPMARNVSPGAGDERVTIAVMRLVMPDVLIPASLDVDGLSGLSERLDAGANVVTSIVPPLAGLAGVANPVLDIAEAGRTLAKVGPVLHRCGLVPAAAEDYQAWVTRRQAMHRSSDLCRSFFSRESAPCA